MTPLVISHSVFLTAEEIQKLKDSKTVIKTVGITVPVKGDGVANTKLTEVFCNYTITNKGEIEADDVELIADGYKLSIKDTTNWEPILDTPEDTSWVFFQVEQPLTFNDVQYLATHQILIQKVDDLERSTVCESLARYLDQKKIA